MNCPNCGAPMRLGDGRECLTCDYCQSVYFPEKNADGVRVLDDPSEFSCPVCAVPLVHAVIEAHPILYCPRCRGNLIPATVFVLILQDLRAHRADTVAARSQGTQAAHSVPPVPPRHGHSLLRRPWEHRDRRLSEVRELNWLDAGELMVIVRAPDHPYELTGGSIWE